MSHLDTDPWLSKCGADGNKRQKLTMTKTKTLRWMKSALAEASKSDAATPWVRGTRRAEMIARRADSALRSTSHLSQAKSGA